MSSILVLIKSDLRQDHAKQLVQLDSSKPREAVRALADLLRATAGGVRAGQVEVSTSSDDPVAAAGAVALTHAQLAANDTLTIGGVTITAKASGATGAQFNIGADATADGVALAAVINANATLSPHLVAVAASGTVTITARQKGLIGNLVVMSTSKSAAFGLTQLTGGTGGQAEAPVVYSVGY